MELAESVNIILSKNKEKYLVRFDNSKSNDRKISVSALPLQDIKAFYDFYSKSLL